MQRGKYPKEGVISPWLAPQEAADYCGISLSMFNQLRRELPIQVGGTPRRPRFHVDELDYWMRKNFQPELTLIPHRLRRA